MNSLQRLIFVNSGEPWRCNFYKYIRPLYSSSVLGIDSFIERRKEVKRTFLNPEIYKSKLKKTCEAGNKGLVFSDDVMNMVHLVENDEDLDLLNKLIKRMCMQTKVKVMKNIFGPEVMRLYYMMNKPSEAMVLVEDPVLYSEFENATTFMIFLDLLFKNELYEKVIWMYEYHMKKSSFSIKSYILNTFYFAACYKLNSEDSLKKALALWKALINTNKVPGMKIKLLFAALLLKQNQIISAMDVLHLKKFNNVAENLKCMALVMSERFYDAFERIRENLTTEREKFFMLKEVVDFIEKEVFKTNEENYSQFLIIKQDLINKNLIRDEALDKVLFSDLESYTADRKNTEI